MLCKRRSSDSSPPGFGNRCRAPLAPGAEATHGLLYMGLSLQDMHKHYLAVLTPDGQRFWAVYLSGPFQSSTRDLRQMNLELAADRQLLQVILESATPAPPA